MERGGRGMGKNREIEDWRVRGGGGWGTSVRREKEEVQEGQDE